MKRYFLLLILMLSVSLSSMGKKDINAWKNEKSLRQQYSVFKENLNFWNGNYFLNEKQLDEFYRAFSDSVAVLENEISDKAGTISNLQNELNSTNKQLKDTKTDLDFSIKNRNSIEIFGMTIDKGFYTLIMSAIILILIAFLAVLFFLYTKSNKVTLRSKKDYDELKEEFEVHKKNALERYTKINMELHHTRMELNKK